MIQSRMFKSLFSPWQDYESVIRKAVVIWAAQEAPSTVKYRSVMPLTVVLAVLPL